MLSVMAVHAKGDPARLQVGEAILDVLAVGAAVVSRKAGDGVDHRRRAVASRLVQQVVPQDGGVRLSQNGSQLSIALLLKQSHVVAG